MLALCGDSSDNVPGVAKIGNKTATTLLKEYGTLENLLEQVDHVRLLIIVVDILIML
jgi:DNA polymerase-1